MHYIIENNLVELEEICRSFNVKRLYVFGSLGNDTFDISKSDVDLIVELEEKDPVKKGEILMILWDKFEDLFGRNVDLLSNPNVRNPYLQQGINATKKIVYEA
jgi:predicted nucleotidyltransferase